MHAESVGQRIGSFVFDVAHGDQLRALQIATRRRVPIRNGACADENNAHHFTSHTAVQSDLLRNGRRQCGSF